jgi:hypothetical protein
MVAARAYARESGDQEERREFVDGEASHFVMMEERSRLAWFVEGF